MIAVEQVQHHSISKNLMFYPQNLSPDFDFLESDWLLADRRISCYEDVDQIVEHQHRLATAK